MVSASAAPGPEMTPRRDRVTAVCGFRGGQHDRRQQGPGMVLSAAQRLQGALESAVRGAEQSGRVLGGPQHGAGGRRQVRTGRNASWNDQPQPSRHVWREVEARVSKSP